MRILILYPYVPWPLDRGTFHRTFHLARELGRRHEVDLFCLAEEGKGSEATRAVFAAFARRLHFEPFRHPAWARGLDRLLDPRPVTVRHWESDAARAALRRFAGNERYDLIHFCDLAMASYAAALPPGPPRVLDRSRVDLLFQREESRRLALGAKARLLRAENLWKLRRHERAVARQVAATVVCGPDDAAFLRREVPEARRVEVIANGVDETEFSRDAFPPQPDPAPTLLFCGAMDYSPNVHGLAWYFREIDPIVRRAVPGRRVLVVGRDPVPEVRAFGAIDGVTVTGGVPDVRPWYRRAWLQLVPLLIGGGTRLKIVESLALGVPVVSTAIGAQGLDLRDGEHLLLADAPGSFAAALARLLGDAALRGRLAEAGRARVLERYTWGRLGGALAGFYERLAAAP